MLWNRKAQKKSIGQAMWDNNLEEFQRLLRKYPNHLRQKDGRQVWLHYAASDGRLPFVKLLVEEFAIGVDEVDTSESDTFFFFPHTALNVAAQNGHLEIVRYLLDQGATLNFEVKGILGCPSLRSAATQGHFEVVKLLVERGAIVQFVLGNTTPVSMADWNGHVEIAKYLQSKGGWDLRETTPPDFATSHRMLLEYMIEHRGPLGDWQVEIPGDPSVTLHTIPAGDKWETRTVFTLGLSDKNLPWEKWHLFQCQELRMSLPADWPFSEEALADPQWNWPVEWLKRLVPQLLAGDFWPPEPVLLMNGEPPQPLADSTQMSGWLCVRSLGEGVEPPDHRCIEVHDLHPIYAEEAAFARQFEDAEELVTRFNEQGIPLYVDPKRKCVVG